MVFTKIGDEISKLWYHTNRRRFLNFVKSGKLLFLVTVSTGGMVDLTNRSFVIYLYRDILQHYYLSNVKGL